MTPAFPPKKETFGPNAVSVDAFFYVSHAYHTHRRGRVGPATRHDASVDDILTVAMGHRGS